MLLLPELKYDEASGDPGLLGKQNGFANFMVELFSQMTSIIGNKTLNDVKHVMIFSHSGGYTAMSAMAMIGGVSQVKELILLDSLYGELNRYDGFVKGNLLQFGNGVKQYRFGNVYTDNGGTYLNSVEMGKRMKGWIQSAGLNVKEVLFEDNTYGTMKDEDYLHSMIVKRSSLGHDVVPTYYFGKFIKAVANRTMV